MFSGWSLHTFGHIVLIVVCSFHIQFNVAQVRGITFYRNRCSLVVSKINELIDQLKLFTKKLIYVRRKESINFD